MLLLTAAEIRETTHIVADGTIAASKLAAGAAGLVGTLVIFRSKKLNMTHMFYDRSEEYSVV